MLHIGWQERGVSTLQVTSPLGVTRKEKKQFRRRAGISIINEAHIRGEKISYLSLMFQYYVKRRRKIKELYIFSRCQHHRRLTEQVPSLSVNIHTVYTL